MGADDCGGRDEAGQDRRGEVSGGTVHAKSAQERERSEGEVPLDNIVKRGATYKLKKRVT